MPLTFIPTNVFTGLTAITQPFTVQAATLREAVAEVDKVVPGFAGKIYTSTGQLRSSIQVDVSDKQHSYRVRIRNLDERIADESEILIDLEPIAGG